jgi:hypothetical protein
MMGERIAILFSNEVQELVAENSVDLEQELRQVGLDVSQGFVANPESQPEGSERDVILVLLAAGVTTLLLASSIAKVIDAIGRNRKLIVEEVTLAPATNDKGDVLHDSNGSPLRCWKKIERIVESSQTTQDATKLTVEAGLKGLRFWFSSGEQS